MRERSSQRAIKSPFSPLNQLPDSVLSTSLLFIRYVASKNDRGIVGDFRFPVKTSFSKNQNGVSTLCHLPFLENALNAYKTSIKHKFPQNFIHIG